MGVDETGGYAMAVWCMCGILGIVVLALLVEIYLLHREMDEIGTQFEKRLEEDTNNLIFVSSRDRHVRRLADRISRQLAVLRSQRRRYQNGDRELKEAVTNISHDLRTPLTAICGYLELLSQEEAAPQVKRYLGQISERTGAMKQLTEELFRYSVLASEEDLKPEEVELGRALEESLLSFYGAFKTRGIVPELSIEEGTVVRQLDAAALGRIFGNILSNALKYSDGDLVVKLCADGHVSFSNEAKALTPVMAARLFDRFYTVETGRSSTGLGLSIARLLTERMGGQLEADYAEGRLTITAYFPADG